MSVFEEYGAFKTRTQTKATGFKSDIKPTLIQRYDKKSFHFLSRSHVRD